MTKGIVYLIGAGPGDPKLITLKGLECLQRADVIIYDRLASPRLLNYARPDAELIFVGKSPERHTLRQEEINQVLVDQARQGRIVARLKGGDPFVFGRGGEEAEALAAAGILFEVVPGITSAIAVPAYAGIPVTHRDFTSTFGIITGHEDPTKDDTSIAWDKLATALGTMVFLMGMENLPQIVQRLLANGRPATTPIALIRWGTRSEQETLVGTLSDIVAKAEAHGFKSPVVIVVGEVVSLREKLQWLEKKPLFGKRVVVTRARAQASVFAQKIEALGGEAWEFPTIEIVPPSSWADLDRAIDEIDSYRWIVFTSINGVKSFFDRLLVKQRDIRDLKGISLVAIGPQTKEGLARLHLQVEYVPTEFRAEAVAEGLRGKLQPGDRVLLPRAKIARKVLPETLRLMGAVVDEVTAYDTVQESGNAQFLKKMLANGSIDLITFTSSSTVHNFMAMLKPISLAELKRVRIACIGPVTADTARQYGLSVDIEAREYTIDGLLQAILEYYGSDGAQE
ncbi:MAG: uroporphyrinogen-III C-methyltransferase [Firmicutes bacterium]|nr:uroporphyrinogen-III C-methyltransferase [Bacillota bacterium]